VIEDTGIELLGRVAPQATATRDDEAVPLREQRVADHVRAKRLRTEARHERRDLA